MDADATKLVKERSTTRKPKKKRTLTGLVLSVHIGENLVAGGGFELQPRIDSA